MSEIRKLESIEEFRQLLNIEKSAWGFTDAEAEPHHLMTRIQKYGGLIQGLFLDGKIVGFSYALLGKWEEEYFIYSHMVAVRQDLQGKGYGFMLKKAQREAILKMGYEIIRWNFDPLESLNGYFNIHRLGAVSEEYERNIYGEGSSGLHRGLPTDRLIATWHLNSDRVKDRMEKKNPPIHLEPPKELIHQFKEDTAYIEIPRDIRTLRQTDLGAAKQWRSQSRDHFESAFQKGYTVTDVILSKDNSRMFYQLKR